MEANDTPCQQVAELQREYERLSLEKHQYLQTLNNSEALKLQLRETRKDAKHLSKQKKKLQAMTDIGKSSEEVMQWVMVLILLKQYFLTLLSEWKCETGIKKNRKKINETHHSLVQKLHPVNQPWF